MPPTASPETSIVKGKPTRRLTNTQPAPHETPSTSTSLSNQREFHLSATSTPGFRTLSVSSLEWRALRKEILLRDDRTCSSCGYVSPYAHGRWMIVDHKDGDGSNNDPSNLIIYCPPCNSIRNLGYAGAHDWLIVAESTMDQVEIVRKTRKVFEEKGVIPHPKYIDPSMKPVVISVLDLTNMLLRTPWKDLPEKFQRLRGFFTPNSSRCFLDTMLPRDPDPDPEELNDVALFKSDPGVAWIETGPPWIRYSEKLHVSRRLFLNSWLPSKTLNTEAAWICVDDPRSPLPESESPDLDALSSAWDKICTAKQRRPNLKKIDKLARRFNVFYGKWLVFASSNEVDSLWRRIAESTLAGTLGHTARVSPRNKEDPSFKHLICVYNSDYRSIDAVNRVRVRLRRLGVEERIGYKPDIYTHCGIYQGNSWDIPSSRYRC